MPKHSLFDPANHRDMLARIERLRPDSPRQWGRMDPAQMLAHCQVALRVAVGEQELKRNLIGFLFGGLAKRSLLKPEDFGKNLPTGAEFRIRDQRDFARERAALIALVQRFGQGPEVLTRKPHPFFGPLTVGEWDALQWKHLDHHLRQFGV